MKNTSATENASEDDTNVLPELIASLFNPCSINYLEAELKESSYKSLTDCFYENSQIIFDHLTKVTHWHNFKQELTLTSLGWELDNESRSFAEKIMDYNIRSYFLELPQVMVLKIETKLGKNARRKFVSTTIIWKLNQLVYMLMKNFPN